MNGRGNFIGKRLTRRLPATLILAALCITAHAEMEVRLSGPQSLGPLVPDEDGRFAFPNVPLRKNSVNTFTVTATDDSGQTVTKEVNITQISLENVVVSEVRTERLSQERIEQLVNDGVIDLDDPSNYNVSTFQIVLTVGTRPVNIDIPIRMPKTEETGFETYRISDPGGPGRAGNPPTQVVVFEQPVVVSPGMPQPPPIPGVIIIQGDIKTLKEFFSVRLLLMNTSGIFTLSDVQAEIRFPDGGLTCILPADSIAGFGDIVPGDGGQPGQAEREFIVRGDEIGVRGVEIGFGGFLTGPGIPEDSPVPFSGMAAASLEVLGPPKFLVQVQHPPFVEKDVPYDLIVDITNAGELPALYSSLELDVGADAELIECVVDPVTHEPVCEPIEGPSVRSLGHIQPGETVRQVFVVNPLVTGPITSCFGIADHNITLQVGVGNKGCLTGQRPAPSSSPDGTPTVAVVPSANALGVGIDSPVVAFFSEKMNESSITIGSNGSFRVVDEHGNVPPGRLRIEEISNATVAIWQLEDGITNRLSPDTQYTVYISQEVKDRDGIALANEWISSFTTTNPLADKNPPQTTLSVLPPVDPNYVLPGQIVRLNAYAADQGTGVGRLELRVRDDSIPDTPFVLVDQKTVFDTTPFPLIFAVDSSKLDPGHTYIYKLTAYDKLGNAQDATLAVILASDASPPTVTLPPDATDPVPQGISVHITPDAASPGVREVYYFLDDSPSAFARASLHPFKAVLPTLGVPVGDHTIRAIAVDGLGQMGDDVYAFTIVENNNPPQARILGPPNGTQLPVGTVFSVSADIQDDVGIAFVGYHLDDPDGPVFATGQHPVTVDTSSLSLGSHRIILRAINNLNRTNDLNDPAAILEFVVVETPPGEPPTAPIITEVTVPVDGTTTVRGTSVAGAQVVAANTSQGVSTPGVANAAGQFVLTVPAVGGDLLSVVAYDLSVSPDPSAPATAVVPEPAELESLEINPGALAFDAKGQTAQLQVTARYDNGTEKNVTGQATYLTSAASVASVSPSGLVVAQGDGSATITASYEGKTAVATVNAAIVTLISISVDPASLTFSAVNETRTLGVTGHYSDETTAPLTGAVFATSSAAVATVNAQGVVTAKSTGEAQITVSYGNLAPVFVPVAVNTEEDKAPTVEILSPVSGHTVERGQAVTVSVRARDEVGGVKEIGFTVSGEAVSGELRAVSPPSLDRTESFVFTVANDAEVGGTIAVEVRARDTGDLESIPASVTLEVVDATPPLVEILEPAPGTLYNYGDTVTVRIRATDAVGVAAIRYETEGGVIASGAQTFSPPVSPAEAILTFNIPFGAADPEVTVRGYAEDPSGNDAPAPPVRITITDADIEPPQTEVTAVSSPGSGPNAVVTYKVLSGKEDLDHVELYFRRNGIGTFNRFTDAEGGNPFGIFPPPVGDTGTIAFKSERMGGDGVYEFYTVGVDQAGNREPAPVDGDGRPVGDPDAQATFNTGAAVTVISTDTEIVGDTYDDRNLRIDGARVILAGNHSFRNLELVNGAVLTHRPTTLTEEPGLSFSAWTVTIDETSAIDVDARGYLGGRRGENSGTDDARTVGNALGAHFRSGGSYGGPGGQYDGTSNPVYGSLVNPVDLGSGGSDGSGNLAGGNGGGRIDIQAINIASDGAISANGGNGSGGQAGSGSGGSIRLAVATLSGTGPVRANGGAHEVGGGGGRIALYPVDISTLDLSLVQALGGVGSWAAAGNGTVYIKDAQEDDGTLVVDGQGASTPFTSLPIPPGFVFDTIIIRNNARVIADDPIVVRDSLHVLENSVLTHSQGNEDGLSIEAERVYVDETSRIDLTGKGYAGGRTPSNPTDDGRTLGDLPGTVFRSGGSYGGYGGVYDGPGSNPPYGHPANPIYLGSGGSDGSSNQAGGNGGGRLTIRATKEVRIDGAIVANGGVGSGGLAGSGSGGSVLIETSYIRGRGEIRADGGANEVGGGGGRIAVVYDAFGGDGDDLGGTRRVTALGGAGSWVAGGAGTVLLRRRTQAYGDLYIDAGMADGTATVWTPLTPLGYGKVVNVDGDTLTLDVNIPMLPGGAVGLEFNPDIAQNSTFTVVANSATELTLVPNGGPPLASVAQVGDTYAGVYRFDNVYLRRGGYLVLGDQLVVEDALLVDEYGRIDHFDATPTYEPRLDIRAATVYVSETSSIAVDARGYLGGRSSGNSLDEGRTLGNALGSTSRSGGSYGGLGASYQNGVPNAVYGDLANPAALGSGGSDGTSNIRGGDGGGWIAIQADDLIVDGILSANGGNGAGGQAGSGSGGTINIRADSVSGTGRLLANGGALEVGGGGGRIAIVYGTLSIDPGQVEALGGLGSWAVGGNGTVFFRHQGSASGDLYVDGADGATPLDSTPLPEGYVFRNVILRNKARVVADAPIRAQNEVRILTGSVLTHTAHSESGVTIETKRLYIDADSRIDVTGRGYAGGRTPLNPTDNGRTLGNLLGAVFRSGGSYGGFGGVFDGSGSNPPYGHPANPVHLGSGGSDGSSNVAGGNGGGRITLRVTDEVVVNGVIAANGNPGNGGQAGSGSGGSVLIETEVIRGTGTIAADGGAHEVGGGGGRVAIVYDAFGPAGDDLGALRNIHAFGGAGSWVAGGAGTVLLRHRSQAYGDLFIDANSDNTAPHWTPLTPVGPGTVKSVTDNTFELDGNVRVIPNGLVGLRVRLDQSQPAEFTVVSNTDTLITVAPEDGVSLSDVAEAGDTYAAIYRFDNIFFRRGGYLVLSDPVRVQDTILIDEKGRLDHFDATVSFETHIDLTARLLHLTADSSINVDDRGYLGGRRPGNNADNGRTLGNALGSSSRSGGSYGGLGAGQSGGGVPNPVYGDPDNPAALGSGGSDGTSNIAGGDGGGWIDIQAEEVVLDGLVSANGQNGFGGQAGSGSGGTIRIVAPVVSGSGTLRVAGGASDLGGGGGRILILHDNAVSDIGDLALSAAGGVGATASGQPGTIRTPSQPTNDFEPVERSVESQIGDMNFDGRIDSLDVQLVINALLGRPGHGPGDANRDNTVDARDVQLVINTVLGHAPTDAR